MKYEHEVIRDLMPLCIDGIASPQSEHAVQEHLAECPDCAAEWAQMKAAEKPLETEPLPSDTPKYTETAERVRRHTRSMLLRNTLFSIIGVIALFTAGIFIGNRIMGNRFSSQNLTNDMIQAEWESDTPEENDPDFGSAGKCSFSELNLRYRGETTSPDGKCRLTFVTADIPDANKFGYWECETERSNPLQLGMWTDSGMSYGLIPRETPILMTYGYNSYSNGDGFLLYYVFCTNDDSVKRITVQCFGETCNITPDENGFGIITRTKPKESLLTQRLDLDEITEGEAFGADGTLLYRIEPTETIEDGETYTTYEWMPVK